jgi:hypothetical protein
MPITLLRDSAHLADGLHLGGSAGIRNLARDADRDARQSATRAIIGQTWNLQTMLECGCDRAQVIDCIDSALNAFMTLDGNLRAALDEHGLLNDERLDLSGLHALRSSLNSTRQA